jgi:hypothetical protein
MQRFLTITQMIHIVTNMLERVKNVKNDDDDDNAAERPDTQK